MRDKEYIPRIAMSIQAHPDDQEFTIAGTLARWANADCKVVSTIITSGEAGSNDPTKGVGYKSVLAKIREAEQIAANKLLGVADTLFMRFPDGVLEPTLDLRRDLTRIIRRYRPEVVIIGDPLGVFYGNGYINHPDHRAAAQAGLYAVFPSAGTRLIFPELLMEGLEPHNVNRLYIHGSDKPDLWVDIANSLDTKVEALKKHASQLGEWNPEKMIREWAAEEGKLPGLEYAEAYKVMMLTEGSEDK
jgi:LmbE family N-acetylglucosaminyl deacetylase